MSSLQGLRQREIAVSQILPARAKFAANCGGIWRAVLMPTDKEKISSVNSECEVMTEEGDAFGLPAAAVACSLKVCVPRMALAD